MHGHTMLRCFSHGCQTDLLPAREGATQARSLAALPQPAMCMHAMLPKHLTCASRFFDVTLTAQAIRA